MQAHRKRPSLRRYPRGTRLSAALFREIADPNVDAEALGTAFFHLLEAIPEPFDEVGHFDLERAKRISRAFLASVFPLRFPLTPGKTTQASSGEQ